MSSSCGSIKSMQDKDHEHTEQLFRLMSARCELAGALKVLAESQNDASPAEQIDVTLGRLARKQDLLSQLAEVQSQLRQYFDDDPEQRVWSAPERRLECRRLSEIGTQNLRDAAQIEETTLGRLTLARDAVAAQLQNGRDSSRAQSAYSAGSSLSASQLDIGDL